MGVHDIVARFYVLSGVSEIFFAKNDVYQLVLSSILKIFDIRYKFFITFFVAYIKFMDVEEFARIVETVVH